MIKIIRPYIFGAVLFVIGVGVATAAWWGYIAEWNPDQMAFGALDNRYFIPKPYSYLRPPLVSYFNLYFSEMPIQKIGDLFGMSNALVSHLTLVWSKQLAAGIFVLSVFLLYSIIQKYIHNRVYAKLWAILFGSSAGLIAYGHFLTADIPLMFFVICTIFFILRAVSHPSLKNYTLAAVMCGITAAVKYNGVILLCPLLFVWIVSSIRVHFGAARKFFVIVAGSIAGFIAGNPYALLDLNNFYRNFLYLVQTTKYYNGEDLYLGYSEVLPRITDLMGLPAIILVGSFILFSVIALLFSKKTRAAFAAMTAVNLSIVVPYILFMGHSSFLPSRYLIPIIPSLFLLALPAFSIAVQKRWVTYPMVIIALSVIGYNFLCAYEIDMRFISDPRMNAYSWSYEHIPDYSIVETTSFSPDLNTAFNKHLTMIQIPLVTERSATFKILFKNEAVVRQQLAFFDASFDDTWFSMDYLYKRNPHYIILNSWQYAGYFPSYPIATDYYRKLLNGETKYKIVFNKATPQMPAWSYPQDVNFLFNRMVILENTEK